MSKLSGIVAGIQNLKFSPCLQFPLCSQKCVGKKLHKAECEIFSKLEKKINFSNLSEKHPIYTTIAPLRNWDIKF